MSPAFGMLLCMLAPVVGFGLALSLHSHLENKSRYYKLRTPRSSKVLLSCAAWILFVAPVIWFGVVVLGFEAIDPEKGVNWRSEARKSLPTHDRSSVIPTNSPNSTFPGVEAIFPPRPAQK